MAYRTYLGAALPDPAAGTEGCTIEILGEGATMTMANGTVVYDYTGSTRYRWTLHWLALTSVQLATIKTRAATKTAQSFSPPDEDDGGSTFYSVYVVPNSLHIETFETGAGSASTRYNVDLQVEEVS